MRTRPDKVQTNKQPTKRNRRKRNVEASGVCGLGLDGWDLGRCSLRQSRERATFLLFLSRPMSGEASRSETRHERGEGPAFQEEGADGITLYNDKQHAAKRHAATVLDLGVQGWCRHVWIVGTRPVFPM